MSDRTTWENHEMYMSDLRYLQPVQHYTKNDNFLIII